METNNGYLDLTDMLNLDQLIEVSAKSGSGCTNAVCPGGVQEVVIGVLMVLVTKWHIP